MTEDDDTMRNPDDPRLDSVLCGAAAARRLDAEEADRVFADAWSRIQASIGDDERDDAHQARRLDLIADRELTSRRRRRAARVASITLAVCGGGRWNSRGGGLHLDAHRRADVRVGGRGSRSRRG